MSDKYKLSNGMEVEPNFIKLGMNRFCDLFWDYYMYVDRPEYTIDYILADEKVKVKFLKTEYCKEGSNFRFCILRCARRDSEIIVSKVFPRLHHVNTVLGGNEYIELCTKALDALNKYAEQRGEQR